MRGLVLFDLDGVLLSEEGYWNAAALTVAGYAKRLHPGVFSSLPAPDKVQTAAEVALWRATVLPPSVLTALRKKAINNNWDKAYVCAIALACADRSAIRHPGDAGNWLTAWLDQSDETGFAFLQAAAGAREQVGLEADLFERVKDCFQRVFLGDASADSDLLRSGLVDQESTLLPARVISDVLQHLDQNGFALGIGTGRPRREAAAPLQRLGLWRWFNEKRICTFDEVAAYERQIAAVAGAFAKPHPFTYQSVASGFAPDQTWIVGDSVADLEAARAADFSFVGIGSVAAFGSMAAYADAILPDVSGIPAVLA